MQKQCYHGLASDDLQIILRARQNYVVDAFRARQTALTAELVEFVLQSWTDYVRTKVSKGLPNESRVEAGKEWESWEALVELFQDKAWKQEGLKRDEKFEMHFTAAVGVPRHHHRRLDVSPTTSDAEQGVCCASSCEGELGCWSDEAGGGVGARGRVTRHHCIDSR